METTASPDRGTIFHEELDHHYQSLEKLYSLMVSIQFALEKSEVSVLSDLSAAKMVLLQDIAEKQSRLERWFKDLHWEAGGAQEVEAMDIAVPLTKIKSLVNQIKAIEDTTARKVEEIRRNFPGSGVFARSLTCELKSPI